MAADLSLLLTHGYFARDVAGHRGAVETHSLLGTCAARPVRLSRRPAAIASADGADMAALLETRADAPSSAGFRWGLHVAGLPRAMQRVARLLIIDTGGLQEGRRARCLNQARIVRRPFRARGLAVRNRPAATLLGEPSRRLEGLRVAPASSTASSPISSPAIRRMRSRWRASSSPHPDWAAMLRDTQAADRCRQGSSARSASSASASAAASAYAAATKLSGLKAAIGYYGGGDRSFRRRQAESADAVAFRRKGRRHSAAATSRPSAPSGPLSRSTSIRAPARLSLRRAGKLRQGQRGIAWPRSLDFFAKYLKIGTLAGQSPGLDRASIDRSQEIS